MYTLNTTWIKNDKNSSFKEKLGQQHTFCNVNKIQGMIKGTKRREKTWKEN